MLENIRPLTELTGLRITDISDKGVPFSRAKQELQKHLGPNAVFVGQAPNVDIEWYEPPLHIISIVLKRVGLMTF
jgi:hypothetical protein